MHRSKPRLVRKYDNRRLYDTGSARYITQGELLELVEDEAEDVVVLLQQNNNSDGRDITAATLAEAMYSRVDWNAPGALAGLRKIYRRQSK